MTLQRATHAPGPWTEYVRPLPTPLHFTVHFSRSVHLDTARVSVHVLALLHCVAAKRRLLSLKVGVDNGGCDAADCTTFLFQ